MTQNLGTTDVLYPANTYTIEDRPLAWQTRGLQETASGYGRKLTSRRVLIGPDGRIRRIYVTCYSNAGTAYVCARGKRYLVNDYAACDVPIVAWGPYAD